MAIRYWAAERIPTLDQPDEKQYVAAFGNSLSDCGAFVDKNLKCTVMLPWNLPQRLDIIDCIANLFYSLEHAGVRHGQTYVS